MPVETVYLLIARLAGDRAPPFFVVFGWLSDRIGRKWIMMAGLPARGAHLLPHLFKAMTHYANPALEQFNQSTRITLTASDCQVHLFALPTTVYSDCDRSGTC